MFISLLAIDQLFSSSLDAMVVCRPSALDDQSAVELAFLNKPALTLLGLSHPPPQGTPLTQLLADEPLDANVRRACQRGEPTTGSLPPKHGGRPIDYEINQLGNWITIRLRESGAAEALQTALGRHVLATNHLAVSLLDPVLDASGQISDFRLAALYDVASKVSGHERASGAIGSLLSEWNPETRKSGLFGRYVAVMEGGQPFQAEQYYKGINTAFDVAASRFGNQLLLTFRRITDTYQVKQRVEQQAALLNRSFKHIHTDTAPLFEQYVSLVETGTPIRAERSLPGEGKADTRWFDVSASKVLDGFASITKEITPHKQALQQVEGQSQLLETILNNSDSFIYLAEAIRNEAGEIVDFRIARSNEAGRQNMIRTVGYDGTGSTLLTMYPFSTGRGLFAHYARVVETGEPLATEFYYEYSHIREWMKISAQKLGDGLVATYVDISESRRAAETAEKYTQQLKGVLDASLNGIILLEAMRDEAGEVVDFRYLLANQSASKINNVPPDQLIGNTLLTLFPSSKTEGSFPGNVYALKTGTRFVSS